MLSASERKFEVVEYRLPNRARALTKHLLSRVGLHSGMGIFTTTLENTAPLRHY